MRLDVYLRTSRLLLRRSVAQELCEKGNVSVNGVPAKASKELKAGDVIKIQNRNRVVEVRVTEIPAKKQLSKTEAPALYEIISSETVADTDPLA
jgi:ribosomal 50S subunit-recycling heat shock protein